MLAYLYNQQTVVSNIVLPELPPVNKDKVGFLFRLESAQSPLPHLHWLHSWLASTGEPILFYDRLDSYHWLRFPGLADFWIFEDAKQISCVPLPEIPVETIRHLLLDQVLPRCLAHQGKIMLHASAVQLDMGVILFIGDSGTGKSTLAGNFHQAGQSAISDDCIWVNENQTPLMAIPIYGGLRLWEDSLKVLFDSEQNFHSMAHYSSKKRVPLNGNAQVRFNNGIPILAVILLSPPGQSLIQEVRLDPLSHREAFIEIGRKTFQLYLDDPNMISHHIQALGHIVSRVSTYRLCMPHDYNLLPIVRQKILEKIL